MNNRKGLKKRHSKETIIQMKRMVIDGVSFVQIAKRLSMGYSTIFAKVKEFGGVEAIRSELMNPIEPKQMELFESKNEIQEKDEVLIPEVNYHNALTFSERVKIKELLDTGIPLRQIANQMERAKNTIVYEVRRNGGREVYEPKKAHLEAYSRKRESLNPLVKRNKEQMEQVDEFETRIKSLEMQVEILSETITQMRNNA